LGFLSPEQRFDPPSFFSAIKVALRNFFLFLFEPAEPVIDGIKALQEFLVAGAFLVLDLDQWRKGDAALEQKGSEWEEGQPEGHCFHGVEVQNDYTVGSVSSDEKRARTFN